MSDALKEMGEVIAAKSGDGFEGFELTEQGELVLRCDASVLPDLAELLKTHGQLRFSTLVWAVAKALDTQGWVMASPSCNPNLVSMDSNRSEPKIRIKSSCKLT